MVEKIKSLGILLAIKHKWAEEIFSGKKGYEFRRIPPKYLLKGMKIFLYSSGPASEISGEFTSGKLIRLKLSDLWKQVGEKADASYDVLEEYFKGVEICSAIEVLSPKKYSMPIPIEEIKRIKPDFVPPQSFYYIKERDNLTKLLLPALNSSSQKFFENYPKNL